MRKLFAFLSFAAALVAFSGCQTRVIDAGGVYQNDAFYFQSEHTIVTTYLAVDRLLKFETANRATLSEDVRRVADRLRETAPDVLRAAELTVQAYKQNPTGENRDRVQSALVAVSTLLTAVQGILQETPSLNTVPTSAK